MAPLHQVAHLRLLRGLRGPKPDIVLCMTDPPIVADVALLVARRYGAPLVVISQDVFPEIAVQLKRLENPLVMRLLRSLVSLYLRRADRFPRAPRGSRSTSARPAARV